MVSCEKEQKDLANKGFLVDEQPVGDLNSLLKLSDGTSVISLKNSFDVARFEVPHNETLVHNTLTFSSSNTTKEVTFSKTNW